MTPTIHVQREDFDVADEIAAITAARPGVGAIVTFTGLCREEEGLAELELEHYPDMAEAEIARAVEEAGGRWPLAEVTVIHRYGRIAPGANIVLVVTAAAHRRAAFAAAEFLMDYLKTRAPFWKRVHRSDGTVGGWIEARSEDDAAAARWHGGA